MSGATGILSFVLLQTNQIMNTLLSIKHPEISSLRGKPLGGDQHLNRWKRIIVPVIFLFASAQSQAQIQNDNWKADLASDLQAFISCATATNERTQCVTFAESSITRVFKLEAPDSESAGSIIPVSFANDGQWSRLGKAYEQAVLNSAQDMANNHRAVVAVFEGPGGEMKHMALILPGKLQFSGSWGFSVPNSASFFLTSPEKSYIEKGLSYAFTKNMVKDVTLYAWDPMNTKQTVATR
jgi:hypothetical protein